MTRGERQLLLIIFVLAALLLACGVTMKMHRCTEAPSCPPPTLALDLADYNGRQADRALAIAEHMVGVYRRCCDEEPVSRCCVGSWK